jgi:Fur family ferric uptake transcriptional regulator
MIEELLKKYNLKVTDKRINILNTIINLNENASIKNILSNCKDMDKTTVYRNLEALEESGLLTKEISGSDIIYLVNGHHKHHLTCTKCHESIEIDCPFDNQDQLNGYTITNHYLNIEGVCNKCQKK